jgi:hypothetical protein
MLGLPLFVLTLQTKSREWQNMLMSQQFEENAHVPPNAPQFDDGSLLVLGAADGAGFGAGVTAGFGAGVTAGVGAGVTIGTGTGAGVTSRMLW